MLKLSIPVAFAVITTVGCSFQVGGRRDPNAPQGAQPAQPAPAPAAAPVPASGRPTMSLGKVKAGAPAPTTPPGTTPPPVTPPPGGIPVLTGTNRFGTGTPDPAGWKGSYFAIPPATQKLPALGTMTPTGILFAKSLDVPVNIMTGGFPGIDATRNENFAIRWEAPLVVDNEADYTFRILSDDGAIVSIDSTVIVDNDGAKSIAVEKSGPVHLVKGTHVISVDYFQTTGSVTLQLFCKKAGGAETICPTRL